MAAKWTRKTSTTMGMTQEEFCEAFLSALNNGAIANKLKSIIAGDLITEVQSLREAVKGRDEKIKQLSEELVTLRNDVDELEQYSRRNSLRITGIPETPHEDLVAVTLNLFKWRMKVTPAVGTQDIDRVHRVGKPEPGKTRAILLKFSTYRVRQRVFGARGMLRPGGRDPRRPWAESQPTGVVDDADVPVSPDGDVGETPSDVQGATDGSVPGDGDTGDGELTDDNGDAGSDSNDATDDTDEAGPSLLPMIKDCRIFLNEDLTQRRSHLLYLCRQAKKDRRLTDCWSVDGILRIKTNSQNIKSIKTLADLEENMSQ